MRVFAYCARSFAESTRKAAGVTPLTSPPSVWPSFDVCQLHGQDLLYFDLHGRPGANAWWGDCDDFPPPRNNAPLWSGYNQVTRRAKLAAVTSQQIRDADLAGCTVFAVNCYLADDNSPMLDALLDAGARYVIGGAGVNWAGRRTLFGAGLLGMWVRRGMQWRLHPLAALALAKRRVWLSLAKAEATGDPQRAQVARDALAFRAFVRRR